MTSTIEIYRQTKEAMHNAGKEALGVYEEKGKPWSNTMTWNDSREEKKQIKQKVYE